MAHGQNPHFLREILPQNCTKFLPALVCGDHPKLDPQKDSTLIRENSVLESIRTRFTDANTAQAFIEIIDTFHRLSKRNNENKLTLISYSQFSLEQKNSLSLIKRVISRLQSS